MKVLFLEDEPVIQDVLAEYMRMKNYDVVTVSDGEAAIATLSREDFDIAVLDIMVPKKNGLFVLEYIKERGIDLPCIMLTALEDEQTQLKAFNLYADDYVIKPVSPIILLKRMETILRRVSSYKTKPMNNKEFYLLEDSYQAFFQGESLNLTLSEFLLLQMLWKEPNRVFTREQIILHIFNEDYIGNDRIIDAHVKNLRKKLPFYCIRTVIGVGYQFDIAQLENGVKS
ncbi:response regulator transcription factor [Lachnoclostridium phytofermentans]|uniref:Stage 0 sporulation protein A homolog n=1 Tax=Lachnoclostridium phytofermentans (strain ATCC 700394 / DSM 18823 / ISDg) TaxID=357809 RepID=A9KNR4_LACP7|nr:response regulator transcription factor [Lachnoclostridium phytofermentans]ABX41665.1 two component transcriptional regulator, winged helix family [Lachnoclostridium phytofermentans ISDg]